LDPQLGRQRRGDPALDRADTLRALMLKGMTAQYLIRQTYKLKEGDTILFHAAAGGVGFIAGQWAKSLGATIIGTVGSDKKAELAKAHGWVPLQTFMSVKRLPELASG
jgi:NADPH:quinone reductase-like Zn-dependent oxidoreductase